MTLQHSGTLFCSSRSTDVLAHALREQSGEIRMCRQTRCTHVMNRPSTLHKHGTLLRKCTQATDCTEDHMCNHTNTNDFLMCASLQMRSDPVKGGCHLRVLHLRLQDMYT